MQRLSRENSTWASTTTARSGHALACSRCSMPKAGIESSAKRAWHAVPEQPQTLGLPKPANLVARTGRAGPEASVTYNHQQQYHHQQQQPQRLLQQQQPPPHRYRHGPQCRCSKTRRHRTPQPLLQQMNNWQPKPGVQPLLARCLRLDPLWLHQTLPPPGPVGVVVSDPGFAAAAATAAAAAHSSSICNKGHSRPVLGGGGSKVTPTAPASAQLGSADLLSPGSFKVPKRTKVHYTVIKRSNSTIDLLPASTINMCREILLPSSPPMLLPLPCSEARCNQEHKSCQRNHARL